MNSDRRFEVVYKGITINGYKGSNYAYIGTRIFNSLLSAKRYITKIQNKA